MAVVVDPSPLEVPEGDTLVFHLDWAGSGDPTYYDIGTVSWHTMGPADEFWDPTIFAMPGEDFIPASGTVQYDTRELHNVITFEITTLADNIDESLSHAENVKIIFNVEFDHYEYHNTTGTIDFTKHWVIPPYSPREFSIL